MVKNRPLRPGETPPPPQPARSGRPNRPNNPGGAKKKKKRGLLDPVGGEPEPIGGVGLLGQGAGAHYIRNNPEAYYTNRLAQSGLNPFSSDPFGDWLLTKGYAMTKQGFDNYRMNTDANAQLDQYMNTLTAPSPTQTGNPFTSSSGGLLGLFPRTTGPSPTLANWYRSQFLRLSPQARGENLPGMQDQPGRWSAFG